MLLHEQTFFFSIVKKIIIISFSFWSVGVSGKMSTETANEDDNFGTESSQKVSESTVRNTTRGILQFTL